MWNQSSMVLFLLCIFPKTGQMNTESLCHTLKDLFLLYHVNLEMHFNLLGALFENIEYTDKG